jgi:hypothetical protein
LRAALREIAALETAYAHDGDVVRLTDDASRLLRRVARRVDPAVASRNDAVWRTFLHCHACNATTRRALDALTDARVRACPALDAPALFAALRVWCRDALRARTMRRADSPGTLHEAAST